MAITTEQRSAIVADYKTSEGDTGSPQVQVALLTARIKDLTEHFKAHIIVSGSGDVLASISVLER